MLPLLASWQRVHRIDALAVSLPCSDVARPQYLVDDIAPVCYTLLRRLATENGSDQSKTQRLHAFDGA
jgi:hypothetical protein